MLKRIRTLRADDREGGFTLTELLIVIVILGVLAGIVVFAVNTFTNDSKKTACAADKKTVEVASDAYYAQKSAYTTIDQLVTGGYLKQNPNTGNTNYTIALSGTGVVTGTLTGGGTC